MFESHCRGWYRKKRYHNQRNYNQTTVSMNQLSFYLIHSNYLNQKLKHFVSSLAFSSVFNKGMGSLCEINCFYHVLRGG